MRNGWLAFRLADDARGDQLAVLQTEIAQHCIGQRFGASHGGIVIVVGEDQAGAGQIGGADDVAVVICAEIVAVEHEPVPLGGVKRFRGAVAEWCVHAWRRGGVVWRHASWPL